MGGVCNFWKKIFRTRMLKGKILLYNRQILHLWEQLPDFMERTKQRYVYILRPMIHGQQPIMMVPMVTRSPAQVGCYPEPPSQDQPATAFSCLGFALLESAKEISVKLSNLQDARLPHCVLACVTRVKLPASYHRRAFCVPNNIPFFWGLFTQLGWLIEGWGLGCKLFHSEVNLGSYF